MATTPDIVRLASQDLEWATDLLTRAFIEEPPTTHLFLGPRREAQVRYFMQCTCAYTLHFGEAHATADRKAVALWLLPGETTMTPGRMYRAGMFAAPWRMGLRGFSRFMGFAGHTDKLHRVAAPMPHYYLFALGVDPAAQGQGLGGALVRHMLSRADREGVPTYLETQCERNVALYERLGFGVAGRGPFPHLTGLDNWGMLRPTRITRHH